MNMKRNEVPDDTETQYTEEINSTVIQTYLLPLH